MATFASSGAEDAIVTGITKRERVTARGPTKRGGEREFDLDPYALVIWNS